MKRLRMLAVLLVALLAGAVLAACSSGSGSPSGATGTSGSSTSTGNSTIVIKNYAYTTPTAVRPGAQITVRNEDPVAHTVTAASAGGFDAKVGANATVTFEAPKAPGRYPFVCTYHPYMKGTLVVRT